MWVPQDDLDEIGEVSMQSSFTRERSLTFGDFLPPFQSDAEMSERVRHKLLDELLLTESLARIGVTRDMIENLASINKLSVDEVAASCFEMIEASEGRIERIGETHYDLALRVLTILGS